MTALPVQAGPPRPTRSPLVTPAFMALFALLITVGALVTYKASGALATLAKADRSGTLAPKAEWLRAADLPPAIQPVVGTLNYFSWVVVALAFGILIGAVIAAAVPGGWLAATLAARGVRGSLLGALLGTPLMLCSCCVVPVFDGVYQRTRRLGPALGLMLAAPALNPAALALTFVLFPRDLAIGRLMLSLALVLAASLGLARISGDVTSGSVVPATPAATNWRDFTRALLRSLRQVSARTLPAILVGALLSAFIVHAQPFSPALVGSSSAVVVILFVAAVAVPLALPTFGEIPLALALLQAGAPHGAVLALLVAGPAINLPSLIALRQIVALRTALATAAVVFAVAAGGGLLI